MKPLTIKDNTENHEIFRDLCTIWQYFKSKADFSDSKYQMNYYLHNQKTFQNHETKSFETSQNNPRKSFQNQLNSLRVESEFLILRLVTKLTVPFIF